MHRDTRVDDIPFADRWSGETCTLNGVPARVCGRMLRYAIIIQTVPLDSGNYVGCEWSWRAVNTIMESGGFFHTEHGSSPIRIFRSAE